MLPKYTIDYSVSLLKHPHATAHYSTDDPVACEEVVADLLDRGFSIGAIKHEGVALPRVEFDKVLKGAASLLASRKICDSLGIAPEEERFRFGFAA